MNAKTIDGRGLSEMLFQTKALHFLNSNTLRGALETKAKRFLKLKPSRFLNSMYRSYGSRFKLKLYTICCIMFLIYNLLTIAESGLFVAAGFAPVFLR